MRSFSRSQLRKTVNRNRNKRKTRRNKRTKNVRGGGLINMQEIPDGRQYSYEGQINREREPHGKGKMESTDSNGQDVQYEGEWESGKKHGMGTQKYKDSKGHDVQYVGQWKSGKMDGKGKMTYKDKQGRDIIYVGEWESGKMHGMGKIQFYNKDNRLTTTDGRWENDKLVLTYKQILGNSVMVLDNETNERKWFGMSAMDEVDG
jgi:hypothetical protein